MNVGVTGASGFIGRHILAALAARGHRVRALVHRTTVAPEFEARTIDLAAPDVIARALEGLDAVIHAAAHVPRSYTDPAEAKACLDVNVMGTLNVLLACKRANVKNAVCFSSGNIYRTGLYTVAETAPIDPSRDATYYLASKACADAYAEHFDRKNGLPVAVLRPSAVYGPGTTGVVNTFASKLRAGEPVVINDGGRHRADLVWVGDVAEAAVQAVEREARGPFNIGSGEPSTVLQIAQTLAELLETPSDLLRVKPVNGDATWIAGFSPLDIARAQRELKYAPRSLADGLSLLLEAS